jgi:hypothetical protein
MATIFRALLVAVLVLYAGAQVMVVWLYLRFGTEGWRETSLAPFGIAFVVLLTLGLGLNARHDPHRPRPAAAAWSRALAVGVVCAGLLGAAGAGLRAGRAPRTRPAPGGAPTACARRSP